MDATSHERPPLRWVPRVASWLIAGVSALVLIDWLLFESGVVPAQPVMFGLKPNTTIAFLLSAAALLLQIAERRHTRASAFGRACAVAVILLGVLTLLDYGFNLDLGIDHWLPAAPRNFPDADRIAMMPPNSALGFVFAGLALLLLPVETRRGRPSEYLALAVALLAFLSLTGYAYSVPGLYRIGGHAYMAPHSALSFLALALGILYAVPDRGLMGLVTSPGPGGTALRRLLPTLCVLALLFGWLRLEGERSGLLNPVSGLALMVTAMIVGFAWLTVAVARTLNLSDVEQRERAAERTARLLEEQAARLNQAILDALEEGLILVDELDRIIKANPRAEQLLGIAEADLIGRGLPDALRTTETGPVRDQLVTLEPPGSPPVALRVNRMPLDHKGDVVTFRDVTHEEAVNRLKSEFISLASHELRTPMTILKGYVEILLRGDELNLSSDRRNQIMDKLLTYINRLARIVNDLLKVSRIEQGTIPIDRRPFAPGPFVRQIMADMDTLAARKGILLRLSLPFAPLPEVLADPDHVAQILHNLLDNAVKYSTTGCEVQVSVAAVGHLVRITVADMGVGIPAAELTRLFERLHRIQSPATLQERGTGLGLYISRTLAELQGGTLIACSLEGVGSTFTLTLPQAPTTEG